MKASRRALRHDVRDGIVRSIMAGEHAPGDRLVEMHIAREYGTSQGPVREALRELEMLGFVKSEPHRGTYVRDPWQRGMLELFQVRGALEEAAARAATPRLREDVAALQGEIEAMAASAEHDDPSGVVEHSERFHRLIIDASGNQLLGNVWSSLAINDHTALTMVMMSVPLGAVATAHQPIVDAIGAGDAELAARVSREHQVWFEELLGSYEAPAAAPAEAQDGAQPDGAQPPGAGPEEGAPEEVPDDARREEDAREEALGA
jgi:DNA-binding GntR family transcriptional regulator